MRGGKSVWKSLFNKPADVTVNAIPAARSDMVIHNLLSGILHRISSGNPENAMHNHCQVYDVTHHASNILLAGMGQNKPLADAFTCPLTSLDTQRKPNPRTCLQVRSTQDYR